MPDQMKRYIGTKIINAKPMTRGDYNALRCWTVPADENPADEGYLVEYTDGGSANLPGFAGYVSWSPKDVFERAYKPTQADDSAIEREIQAKGKTAPRVTEVDIEANIAEEVYFTAASRAKMENPAMALHPSLSLLTFCVLVLRNGFTVTGESAVASPENLDADISRKIARQNAVAKVWPLLGYALRSELSRPVLTEADALADLNGTPQPDNPSA